jgi:hypothetical protein
LWQNELATLQNSDKWLRFFVKTTARRPLRYCSVDLHVICARTLYGAQAKACDYKTYLSSELRRSRAVYTLGSIPTLGCCFGLRRYWQGGGERDMNYVSQVCEVGMMRFTLREDCETDFLGRAAEEILQLPSVLRVRTNPARQEIEITFKQPAEGLLRQVNNALRLVGTEMTASKVR